MISLADLSPQVPEGQILSHGHAGVRSAGRKKAELNKSIEELEKRLEQAKRRNAQVSLHLEARKKALEQAGKVP
ncbi:hypothetical protein Patl1_28997 [Pistacia atlantica]|uniref:Uncharacterized protein n=1 Tax=Pistacia atlantica TaxID=434234 RepID=A0ACC1BF69_9ROSI|nr:hypothetical protein Patl1_28997 [Pistacia atlantica]